MAHLLLIDADPVQTPKQVRQAFPDPSHRVEIADTGSAGLERVRTGPPDVILLALRLPDQSGLEVYGQIRRMGVRTPVIFVTMVGTADAAIEAMKQGAYDYLFKPLEPDHLRRVVGEALEVARWMQAPDIVARTQPDPEGDGTILGSSPAMREVYKAIGRVAAQDVPVLITGESGTGKELVARAIYQHGSRADSAVPGPQLRRDPRERCWRASSSATRRAPSPAPTADAPASSSSATAARSSSTRSATCRRPSRPRSCRLMQEQAFERVGGNETVRTDVRLIAATHRDLKAGAAEGRFRPDLYYRLGVFTIHLPPLRERGDDLPLLVRHYLRRYSRELGRDVTEVAPDAMERLRSHPWPGNIRELQNVLKQSLLRASGTVLLPSFLPEPMGDAGEQGRPSSSPGEDRGLLAFIRERLGPDTRDLYAETHRQADRQLLVQVLEYAEGNQYRAARLLGIARQTLRLKLRELGLHVARCVESEPAEAAEPAWDEGPSGWLGVGSGAQGAIA